MSERMPGELEGDEKLFETVTEGLRAGPGTVAWEDAMRAVRSLGLASGGEDLETLAQVRRHLQAGRSWREIRAGEGFTRKLMARLDEASAEGRKGSGGGRVAKWIAGLAVGVVGAVLVWAVVSAVRDVAGGRAGQAGGGVGGEVRYGAPLWVWDFSRPWPARTAIRGAKDRLKLASGWFGMRLAMGQQVGGWGGARLGVAAVSEVDLTSGVGGGVGVSGVGIGSGVGSGIAGGGGGGVGAGGPGAGGLGAGGGGVAGGAVGRARQVEVTMDVPGRLDPAVVTQIFLTQTPESLDADLGVSEREWVWQLEKDGVWVVTPSMQVMRVGNRLGAGVAVVRIDLPMGSEGGELRVSVDGVRQWAGPWGLGRPVYVGVRYLARGEERGELKGGVVTLKQVRVLGE